MKNTLKDIDLEKLSPLKVKLCIDSFGFNNTNEKIGKSKRKFQSKKWFYKKIKNG
ncbi:hypothetical protein [Flavobacterium piscis]|uniref:Uncharacterized protein n=1 Tax=Flavobacterium piscis TaxID=1114874 RepID=A0ABU1Y3H5_9FLAO|nr:hypothetical protein [Flavobacterium piscis]MDR7208081.1 hypothetical protein [Flavobacterium piscis]